jgi:catechol 2,3-dioxygenase-like lactoylglutathione lyase family enzyme
MRKKTPTAWSLAVRSIALLAQIAVAILVPAVSAQHLRGSPNRSTSENVYTESKFELATTDPSRDVAFYSELGFRVVAKTSYGYVTLKSGPVVIALSPVTSINPHDPASLPKLRRPPIGVEIVLYTNENLEKMHARLKSLGLNPTDIRLQPWGVRDFRLTDPGGYYIRISEGHAIAAK